MHRAGFFLYIALSRYDADEYKLRIRSIADLMLMTACDIGSGACFQRMHLSIELKFPFSLDGIEDMRPRVAVLRGMTGFFQREHSHDMIAPTLVWTDKDLFGDVLHRISCDLLLLNIVSVCNKHMIPPYTQCTPSVITAATVK